MKLVRESLVKLVDSFNPAPDKDHFGLITFNNKASVNFKLNDKEFYDKYQLENRIGEMSLDRAYKTRTDLAMNAARDELFTPSGGDRPDKPNVMIVLTDGKPQGLPKRFSFEKFSADFYGDPKVLKSHVNFQIAYVTQGRGGGGTTMHGLFGMCRCEGYGFQAVHSGIGYINQRL